MSSGPGRRCGVLGDPIAHSLSPALHRAAYAELGLDWTYDAHRVASGDLARVPLRRLDAEWRGLSLTMPLKREALPLVDRLTDRARLAGAVNTLVLEDDGTRVGDNTDLPGAVAAIRERTSIPLATATILGGGATATSVGLALADLGVRTIVLAVRDEARAAETLAALRAHPAAPEVVVSTLGTGPAGSDIVVSTIPASAQTPELVARCADVPVVFDVAVRPVAHAARRPRRRAGRSSAAWTSSCTRRCCSSSCSPDGRSRSTCCEKPANAPLRRAMPVE